MKLKKTMLTIVIIILALYGLIWLFSIKKHDIEYGISFNQNHAASLDLDWREAYVRMLDDLKPKYVRIAAMWSEIEKDQDNFDFIDTDWMMSQAERRGIKVTLVVGQKAPRWPECHVPGWAKSLEGEEYKEKLLNYVSEVSKRYKDHEALEIWQVENEPFVRFRFGECEGFDKEVTLEEIDLVRSLDSNHKILVTDSGELSTWRRASQAGDLFGTTLYRVVRQPSGRIFGYGWLPPAFYNLKARFWGINLDEMFVSELQAEPWFTNGGVLDTPLEEQAKTMDLKRLEDHFNYASRIGVPRVYLWGVEWWYWMKEVKGQSEYWDFVKKKLEIRN